MQTLTLEIKDEKVLDKIVWMLNHFKDDGVTIKNTTIEGSLKKSVDEMNQIKKGNLKAKPIEDFLDEL